MGRARSRWPLWAALATAWLWAGIAHADWDERSAELDWNDPGIDWHAYRDGVPEMIRTGKPAILVFFTEWCPQCRTYSRVFHVPGILALSRRFAMIRAETGYSSRPDPKNCSERELLHTSSLSRWAILSSNQDGSTLRQHDERNDDEAKPEEARSAVPPRGSRAVTRSEDVTRFGIGHTSTSRELENP